MRFSTYAIIGVLLVAFYAVPIQAVDVSQYWDWHQEGTVLIAPEEHFQLNFTWAEIEFAMTLTFYFTTNDTSTPIYLYIENATYIYESRHDWFGIMDWTGNETPTSSELWWFTMYNRHVLRSVNVSYQLIYTNRLSQQATWQEWVLLGTVLSIGLVAGVIWLYKDWKELSGDRHVSQDGQGENNNE